jgi:hypothetical protein
VSAPPHPGPEPAPRRRNIRDLTPGQQALLGVGFAVQVALFAAALIDLRRRPARKVRGDKRWWAAAAFVNYVGPLAYFLYGRKR